MAIAFTFGADSAGSASSLSITRSATFGAGETIPVMVQCAHGTATCTVSDSGGHTWNLKHTERETSFGTRSIFLFEAHNVGAGVGVVITANFSVTVTNRHIAYCRGTDCDTGATTQDADAQYQGAPGTSADAVTTGLMTPTSQPNAVLGFAVTYVDGSACNAGTGFTSLGALTAWNALAGDTSRVEFKRTTSTSDVAATFTVGSAGEDVFSIGGIFTETGGGGGGRTTKNTRAWPLGMEIGMGWVSGTQV